MNRRNFVTGLLSAPVIALGMEKTALMRNKPLNAQNMSHPRTRPADIIDLREAQRAGWIDHHLDAVGLDGDQPYHYEDLI